MDDSALATATLLTGNCNSPRNHVIDTITPHYMCWYTDGETCAESFVPAARQASANYCIGRYGDIVLNVHERDRAWTTGSAANDHRAVTIECANYMDDSDGHAYGQLPDATWDALVRLCADICRRNGKGRLIYRGSADYIGLAANEMILTKHKWFRRTDCPGPWLDGQFDRLAREVNERLGGGGMTRVNVADVWARIHYDMVMDPRNGYSQHPDRWGGDYGGSKTLEIYGRRYTYLPGSFDCASSVIVSCRLALQGTRYEGVLDEAEFTGNMEDVFLGSGLFTSSLTPAKRGDIYLTPFDHTAMCQDGGSDDVFGWDCLSEFNMNEQGGAYYGEPGDQTGYEAVFREYYDRPWATVLHYNGKADFDIKDPGEDAIVIPIQQEKSSPKNSYGFAYRVHIETGGWLDPVRDGQTAGTTGLAKRVEGLKITPPADMDIDVYTHVQGIGNLYYDNVRRGSYDPVMGSVGQSRRMEALMIRVTSMPANLAGKSLRYQGHVQGVGWTKVCKAGEWCGTRGEGRRLEALRIWIE